MTTKKASFKTAVDMFTKNLQEIEEKPSIAVEPMPKPKRKSRAKTKTGVDPYKKEDAPVTVALVVKQVAEYKYRPPAEPVDRNMIQQVLASGLKMQKPEFVLVDFKYQGCIMWLTAIIAGKVSEFTIVTTQPELDAEMKKLNRLGKIVINKQSHLKSGKALPNYFWFVVPAGHTELISKLPAYAGILTFSDKNVIKQHRKAPALHKSFIQPGSYKSIALHLQALLEAKNAK